MLIATLLVAGATTAAQPPAAPPPPLSFSALGAGAVWRFEVTTDMLDGETPARSTIDLRVTEERAERRGARVVRWEWVSAEGPGGGLGVPTAVIIDRRGMRLEGERRSPTLPPAFARIRTRETINRTFVALRDGLGCFEHRHQGRGEGEFYAWSLCFDEMGTPRRATHLGTGSETRLDNPVVVTASTRPDAVAPTTSADASESAFARWLLEIGEAITAAGTGRAPGARFQLSDFPDDDLRATARAAPLGRDRAELLAVTARVAAIVSDPGWIDATAIVLPDGRVRWAGLEAGRGAPEWSGDATLARQAPAAATLIGRLATGARGSCELPRLAIADVPWATGELAAQLVADAPRFTAACAQARTLTGTALPHLAFVQVIVRAGGQIHVLKSYFDRTASGRLWVRAATLEL